MKISVLDCTLRDGGYINNWLFRKKNILSIVRHLDEANVDFIECGYLNYSFQFNSDSTIFPTIESINYITSSSTNSKMVAMVNFGEYPLLEIPDNNNFGLCGIRVAFHQNDWFAAIEYCRGIQSKGYKVFVQPMITNNYSDRELLELINAVNELKPFAFYIVDSFGVMKETDLIRISLLIDNNLHPIIKLGYHAHNNLQLAFSNAQTFTKLNLRREKIIDSSVYGMGRGAGNLNTELYTQFLNDNFIERYKIKPLLEIIDESLLAIYQSKYWGYSLPHFISAKHNCHPNYATYLVSKNSLTIDDIENIISKIDQVYKNSFNKEYAEKQYISYQLKNINNSKSINRLFDELKESQVLIIGPGKNINDVKKILSYIRKFKPITISVNFEHDEIKSNFVFVSNIKRYEALKNKKENLIVTSNINNDTRYVVDYNQLLYDENDLNDNALLMLLKLLNLASVKDITLAGFDGYDLDLTENYFNLDFIVPMSHDKVKSLNKKMKGAIQNIAQGIPISFLTESKYEQNNQS
ncbi:aldolase catalytic domain-containing protein [Lysinibacillus sp. NPDC093688]|uniref:aldolase catalytic domain-containing protein n=1 Tax=Lysinibacillus sp. NPDC093688 TaxID=3390577 RepID=UPI003D081430